MIISLESALPPRPPPAPSFFVAVFHQASAIVEKDEVSCHGNATQNSKLIQNKCFAKS